SGKLALMTVFHNGGQWDTSNVQFDGARILAYDKRNRTPRMRHIDYGLGAFQAEAFADLAEDCPTDLSTIYQALLARGQLDAYEVTERFYEIGSVEGIRNLEDHLR